MSAFKQFTTKDVTITSFDPNKKFSFNGEEITGVNDLDPITYTEEEISGWIESSPTPNFIYGSTYNKNLGKFIVAKASSYPNINIYTVDPTDNSYTLESTISVTETLTGARQIIYSEFNDEYYLFGKGASSRLSAVIIDSSFNKTGYQNFTSTGGVYDQLGIIESNGYVYFINSFGINDFEIFDPNTLTTITTTSIPVVNGNLTSVTYDSVTDKFFLFADLPGDGTASQEAEIFVVDNGTFTVRKIDGFSSYPLFTKSKGKIVVQDGELRVIYYDQTTQQIYAKYNTSTETLISTKVLDPSFDTPAVNHAIITDNTTNFYLLTFDRIIGYNSSGDVLFQYYTSNRVSPYFTQNLFYTGNEPYNQSDEFFDPNTNSFILAGVSSNASGTVWVTKLDYGLSTYTKVKNRLEGIEIYSGVKPLNNLFNPSSVTSTGIIYPENTTGVYYSIKQLYYSNYQSSSLGDTVPTQSLIPGVTPEYDDYVGEINAPRYENYLQSTLTQSRYFPTTPGDEISAISIPNKLYGNNIVPQTFEFSFTSSVGNGYFVKDDGEGNLIITDTGSGLLPTSSYYGTGSYGTSLYGVSGTTPITENIGDVVGQIFYPHGIATFTTGALASVGRLIDEDASGKFQVLERINIEYSSSVRIYENQYKCRILENEYGYSQNPSILSGSSNDVYYDFATGSEFTPYVTTVGLYNERNELLVVGKLSSPVPVSQYVDTTIIVNFDMIG